MSGSAQDPHVEKTAHASTPEPGDHDPLDLTDSDQDTRPGTGGMGVSSETEGPTGPGQQGTSGLRYVGPTQRDPDAAVLPEQSSGGRETNPDPAGPPKSGYSKSDPRSKR